MAKAESGDRLSERSAILINLKGGLSHIDSFDPKPDARSEFRGEFATIGTAVSGVRFCEHLPRLAQCFDKFAVLRSFSHTNSVHHLAQKYVLAGDMFTKAPSMGAIAAFRLGRRVPPVHIAIPNLAPNAGTLGPSCDPYNVLGDGGALLKHSPDPGDASAVASFERRVDLLRAVDGTFSRAGVSSYVLDVRRTAYEQAIELIGSKELRQALNLDREDPKVREAYGDDHWAEYLLLARRLIEVGSRFAVVTFDDRGGFGSWDTHRDNFKDLSQTLLPRLDRALSALLKDLDQRGMLKSTIVAVLGEMGRTPRVNGNAGRDHWPRAMSMLWAGGDIKGGRVVGQTDEKGTAPTTDPVSPEDVAFTLLAQLNLRPREITLPPYDRRLLPGARAIEALVS